MGLGWQRSETRRPASRRLLGRLSDERLVELVRRGNEPAFEELFDRHSKGVLSFCSHILCSREEGEDALQHAFLAVYQAIGERRFEPLAFKPWLYTIARNRCISTLRSRKEAARPLEEENVAAAEQTADRADQQAEVRELLGDIRDLPEPQRAALLLSELGGLSHAQIAQVVGCSSEKVKSLVYQARTSLCLGREARATPCSRVREQLAGSPGSRLPLALRRHLKRCEGCSEFASEIRRRRRLIAIALPLAPSIGLKRGVLAAVGGGGGGGSLAAGLASKGASMSGASAGIVGETAGAGVSAVLATKAGLVVAAAAGVTAVSLGGIGVINESSRQQGGGQRTSASEGRSGAAERQTRVARAVVRRGDGRAGAAQRQRRDRPRQAAQRATQRGRAAAPPAALARVGGSPPPAAPAGVGSSPPPAAPEHVGSSLKATRFGSVPVPALGVGDLKPVLGVRPPTPDLGPVPDLGVGAPVPDLGGRVPDLGAGQLVPDLSVGELTP
ncbi:MAG: sigma-70 family RNA polymerase sigma factor [Actinomycetota bacterium]|nr:sigma-70 family RNA polymerase sigma factor [Actinomycetota bacterium]